MGLPGLPRVAAALAAGLLAAACADDGPDEAGPGIQAGDEYVALGDSFTASPWTGDPDGDDGCLRSVNNYPHLVAAELDLELTDVSCGGATTADLEDGQLLGDGRTLAPQLDAVERSTDLVTVSIGGNDGGLYGRLTLDCVGAAAADPAGAPCTRADAADGDSVVERVTAAVEERVVELVDTIGDRAPRARVIVVGYPQVFPATGTCEQLPLAAGDHPLARRYNVLLDDALERAAERTDAEFVDVFAATEQHDICGTEPWVAGVQPTGPAAPYHPYPQVPELVADLVVDRVR